MHSIIYYLLKSFCDFYKLSVQYEPNNDDFVFHTVGKWWQELIILNPIKAVNIEFNKEKSWRKLLLNIPYDKSAYQASHIM